MSIEQQNSSKPQSPVEPAVPDSWVTITVPVPADDRAYLQEIAAVYDIETVEELTFHLLQAHRLQCEPADASDMLRNHLDSSAGANDVAKWPGSRIEQPA